MNFARFYNNPLPIWRTVMRILRLPDNFVKFSIRSKRSLLLAIVVVVAILLPVSIFVAKRSSAHVIANAKKKQQGCCSDQPAVPRRMIGTYYTTEDGFQSTLILNNKGPNQIMVTPILHSQNGQTFTASPVAVSGQSSSEVDLNALAQVVGPQFHSGSFEFAYEGRLLEMGGGLRIVNAEKSLIFDEQMLEPGMKFPSARLEAVYAVPFEGSEVSVIVSNTTDQPIIVNGDAIFAGTNGHHPIQGQLGPHETQVVNLPHGLVKKASAGAVSLNHNGVKGALLGMIHLQDAHRGYSESVNFTNPGGKTNERQGAGLRLGDVNKDPLRTLIAVRNIGTSETTVVATIPYSKQNGETGTITLPQVSLAPGEIKLLNTLNPQLRRTDFDTAGLEIRYTGAPGSVIASASSVSRSGNHVFAVPMKDPKGGLSSTGGYPWFINESSSTVVFIKNTTDKPQDFILSIIYPGGRWGLIHPAIPAGQTISVDVRKLRDSQQKGVGDSVIPPDAVSGHISWGVRGIAEKVLIGRAQTVDFARGMAATYECQCPCAPSWTGEARMSPGNPTLSLGEQRTIVIEAEYIQCLGGIPQWFEITPFDLSTSSDNPFVVTYSLSTATAQEEGSAGISAQWTEQMVFATEKPCPTYPDCGPIEYECHASFPTAVASTTVTVRGVKIKKDGQDVTGQTLPIIVGQEVELTLSPDSGSPQPSNLSWNITGSRKEKWDVKWKDEESPTSAMDIDIAASDNPIKFFWHDGDFNAKAESATATFKINNRDFIRRVNFRVFEPLVTVTAQQGTVSLDDNFDVPADSLHYGKNRINQGTPGMLVNFGSVTIPLGLSGTWQWVQTITKNRLRGSPFVTEIASGSGLDTLYPYPFSRVGTGTEAEDSPGQVLLRDNNLFDFYQVSDNYITYLMFKPNVSGPAHWVPMRRVIWRWGGKASYFTGTGWAGSALSSPPPVIGGLVTEVEYPRWTINSNKILFVRQ
jgi:hypothetical protein